MPFEINQQVIFVGTNNEIGTVIEGPIERRGQSWYKVRFGGITKNCQEDDLKPYISCDDPKDAFRNQVFAYNRKPNRGL